MDLIIENVERLTLNLGADRGDSFLASLLSVTPLSGIPRATPPAAAAPKFTSKSWSTPRQGDVWTEQGGTHSGYMRGAPGQPDYYLIAASDVAGETCDIAWSPDYSDTDATSTCDGLANTRALVASVADFPAAKWAAGLTLAGFSDWYLPSQRELALAWAIAPEAFAKALYWSSTQYSRYDAWSQSFGDGSQLSTTKTAQLRARAFRRFIP